MSNALTKCYGTKYEMKEKEPTNNVPKGQERKRFFIPKNIPERWIMLIAIFFGVVAVSTMQVDLAMAITKMVKKGNNRVKFAHESCLEPENVTLMEKKFTNSAFQLFDWSEYTQGVILSSYSWTTIGSNIVGGMIVQKLGGKYTLMMGILSMSILTLLIPVSAIWGDAVGLICVQVLLGFADGLVFPSVSTLISRWIPPHERSVAGSTTFSGISLGSALCLALSGYILEYSDGAWPNVFYVFGSTGIISTLLIGIICYDRPSESPFISEAEIKYLHEFTLNNELSDLSSTPWRKILTSKSVWALAMSLTGAMWSLTIVNLDMPKYTHGVLKMSSKYTGFFLALPGITIWIFSFLASFIADFIIAHGKMSITQVRKIGVVLTGMCPGIFVVAASYAGCNRLLFVIFVTIGMTTHGCINMSILVNPSDLAPNYSGPLMGLVNGISSLSDVFAPYVVGILTPNQTISEWRSIFWTLVAINSVTSGIYTVFGSGDEQDWNSPESLPEKGRSEK